MGWVNNRERVSANLLSNASIEVLEVEGKNVIEVRVPRATRQRRPVFVGKNPLGGTFIRNHKRDYRCPDETLDVPIPTFSPATPHALN